MHRTIWRPLDSMPFASWLFYLLLLLEPPPEVRKVGQRDGLDRLMSRLSSRDREAKLKAMLELSELGHQGASAVPELIRILKDEDTGVANAAARTLKTLGEPALVAL